MQREGYEKHPNHEPAQWEYVNLISCMEVAVVQATRAVEGILGKPGNRGDRNRLRRAVERWKSALDLDPNDEFKLAGLSYLDYYYEMFSIRGDAAHSLGALPFELSREMTIQAQTFAWLILADYFGRNSLEPEEAAQRLNINEDVVASEPKDFETQLTWESRENLPPVLWAEKSQSRGK